MKQQLWKALLASVGAVVGLLLVSPADAQDDFPPEVFLMSYPNANITVDGDASDWNLGQFGTFVDGGVAADGDEFEWERTGGTGDIARLGWDDAGENVYYGAKWTAQMSPDDRADNSVKIYARDNATHQYFLADIVDDEVNVDDEAAWANDCVEFYFDPGNDRGPRFADGEWDPVVQLVIDADNQVQVWNSPIDYEEQVEEGVESAITITDDGWLLEVAIDKSVFSTPIPAVLGPANDPAGNNWGIDFGYRDNDDPDETGTRNGDNAFSTDYVWADPEPEPGFPTKIPSHWGQMIAGVATVAGDFNGDGMLDAEDINTLVGESAGGQHDLTFDLNGDNLVDSGDVTLWAKDLKQTWIGDANVDGEFNSSDLVVIFQAGKFEADQDAVWTEGDWTGNHRFDTGDLVVAFQDGGFELGPRIVAAVPEPSTASALPLALVTWGLLRRRRR